MMRHVLLRRFVLAPISNDRGLFRSSRIQDKMGSVNEDDPVARARAGIGDQAGTAPGTDAADAADSEVPKARGRSLRRLMILLGLAVVGLAAGVPGQTTGDC
jgi:hypothetical protein